jgi:hypothetical protein
VGLGAALSRLGPKRRARAGRRGAALLSGGVKDLHDLEVQIH